MQNDITDSNDAVAAAAKAAAEQKVQSLDEQLGNIIKKVADKIKACENILVALSKDPSVDEISAAIGLTMVLNKLGKHVTAIYSGNTPNTLEFLKPSETFEKDTNSLQDFIIALSKDKADHLRYKIEGDYVKVYITPYKTTISQNDLEFSQGDFNVDLVIAIDVDSAEVLDAALEEYGRIMHDATAINITTNQAGHFAELEWSDPSQSSCCEMIVNLCDYLEMTDFDQPTATALLTGIVSATERFSNARTTSETMQISSRLMQAGADQQLISSNIMQPEAPAEPATEEAAPETPATPAPAEPAAPAAPEAPLEPLIPAPMLGQQPAPAAPVAPVAPAAPVEPVAPAAPVVPAMPAAPVAAPAPAPEPVAPVAAPTPEQQLEQMVAAPVAATGMPESLATELANATPAPAEEPEILVGTPSPVAPRPSISLEPAGPEGLAAPTSITPEPIQQQPASNTFTLPGQTSPEDVQAAMNSILNPGAAPAEPALPQIISQGSVMNQNVSEPIPEAPDYGAMIDQALSEAKAPQPMGPAPINPAVQAAPVVPEAVPEAATIPNMELTPAPIVSAPATPAPTLAPEPAAPAAPVAPVAPAAPETPAQPIEVPAADVNIELPPPPIPAIDANGGMPPVVAEAPDPILAMPPAAPEAAPAPAAPAAPEAPAAPGLADPSAFQIPQA